MPAIRFPGRARRNGDAEAPSTSEPTPGQLESGVVR
jgi:hypothetical protein